MIRKKEEEKQEEPIHSKHREAEQTDGTKRYKRMQGFFKINNHLTPHAQYILRFFIMLLQWHKRHHTSVGTGRGCKEEIQTWHEYATHTAARQLTGALWDQKAWYNTDLGSIPWCGKGSFPHGQFSVQTLLRCLYTPLCNGMHKHLCTL